MKRGLFGGTFDPPHVGHLMMAEVARESVPLDVVDFVPANIPPHKQNSLIRTAEFRVKLLHEAVRTFSSFQVSTVEIDRSGTSYTVDTVRQYIAEQPNDEFYFLLGADMLKDLPRWKEAETLLSLLAFIVAPRRGVNLNETISELYASFPSCTIIPLEMPELDISSTWLRERMQKGKRVDPLLPAGVNELIHLDEGIY